MIPLFLASYAARYLPQGLPAAQEARRGMRTVSKNDLQTKKSRAWNPAFSFLELCEDVVSSLPSQPVSLSTNHFLSPGMIMGPHMGSAQFLPLSSSRVINSRFRSLLLISFLRMDCLLLSSGLLPCLSKSAYTPGRDFTIGAALKLPSDIETQACRTERAGCIRVSLMEPLGAERSFKF
jgi:hypothetical protein